MNAWLAEQLGEYTYRFYTLSSEQLQFVLAALFFCLSLRRKPRFFLRLLLGLTAGTAVLTAAIVLRTKADSLAVRIVVTFFQYSFTLPLMFLCFDEEPTLLLKTWCTSIAVKEIVGGIYPVLQFVLGYDPHQTLQLLPLYGEQYTDLNWAIYLSVHTLLYFFLWRLVRKFTSREPLERGSRKQAVILSLAALLLLSILGAVTNHYRDESLVLYICTRVFAMTVAAFILMQYAGLEFRSRSKAEIAMMDHVLSEERKQFAQMKENIDIINMHCHDLKHQLADFSGRLTDREIAELQEAMEIYDSNIRTGSEALDVVLYIHQLTCRQEGIILTCLADGGALSFMRTRHIYALFNNAISNAQEAVRKVSDPERRVIGVTVEQAGDAVEIEVTNYYEGTVQMNGALPQTSKADKGRHGFGTMSMRYITEQYHGTLTVEAKKGIYTLHVSLPVPKGKASVQS